MLRGISKLARFRFASEVEKVNLRPRSDGVTYYKEGQMVSRNAITLKKTEDIESYVIKTIRNYFRTTYKNGKPIILFRNN